MKIAALLVLDRGLVEAERLERSRDLQSKIVKSIKLLVGSPKAGGSGVKIHTSKIQNLL